MWNHAKNSPKISFEGKDVKHLTRTTVLSMLPAQGVVKKEGIMDVLIARALKLLHLEIDQKNVDDEKKETETDFEPDEAFLNLDYLP